MNLLLRGTATFLGKTTLRVCKILCKKSEDIGNYREAGRSARIGMYKKMYRIIEKEKGGFLVRIGIRLFLCYR
jgi:hypothetical protein